MALNKTAFSLASLVVLLAFCFAASSAMAQFEIKLDVSEGNDISFADGNQVFYRSTDSDPVVTIKIMSTKVVDYHAIATAATAAADPAVVSGTALGADDFTVIAYNKFGGIATTDAPTLRVVTPSDPADGMNFTAALDNISGGTAETTRVLIVLKKDSVELADPRAELEDDGTRKDAGKNKEASIELHYFHGIEQSGDDVPRVYFIKRPGDLLLPVTEATFDVIVLLSEEPKKDTFTKDRFDISNATWGDPVALGPIPEDRDGPDNQIVFDRPSPLNNDNMPSTGYNERKIYKYLLTVTPKYENKNDIVIKINDWETQNKFSPEKYTPPTREVDYVEGTHKLTIKVGKGTPKDAAGGIPISVPENTIIPKDGYLVVAKNVAGSAVRGPGGFDTSPVNTGRAPFAQTYNLVAGAIPNLESFLTNGGTIDVTGPKSLVITEIMWGSDASLKDADASAPSNSQWIELKNTSGAEIKAAADAYKLIFYAPNETPPAKTAAVAATATALVKEAELPAGVTDRVGTITDAGAYWSIAGKGQSGRTGEGEGAAALTAVVPTQAIISMYRVADATDKLMDGNTATAWTQSTPPSLNFDPNKVGVRIGSPGRDRLLTAADEAAAIAAAAAKVTADAAAAAKAADTSVSMPKVGQIYISEVMFAGGGTLPQWIEIANGSRSEQVNLSGWTLTVENATADADVSVGAKAVFTIPEGTRIDPSGQHETTSTILVVTEQGRHNLDAGTGTMGEDQILNLWTDQQTELILLGVTKRRYSLLSDMAFQITLAPPVPIVAPVAATPAPTTAAGIAAARTAAAAKKAADATAALARKQATDVVGNLGTAGTATWALPMDEGARSSIIRRHVQVSIGAAEPEDGMMMDSWALASDTSFAQITHIRASSYYGSADDVGTPGFRAGGALPVELSHFRPERNKDTGTVVITWSTQSELNNAGFFIKRSQQRDGEFQIINATMIAGAGTSSEKQFYTYQDTTAQPNVVYYYQIEDVSLDGNRQTLTRGIRLKGHVGAAGKLTTMWGDLKTQE